MCCITKKKKKNRILTKKKKRMVNENSDGEETAERVRCIERERENGSNES